MKPVVINKKSFEREVLQNNQLTIVDFWAPWCGPCKMIAPLLDEFASKYEGKVKVTKLNVEENSETSQHFGVTGIPTLLFFRNGQIVDRLIGAVPKSQLESRIQRLLQVQEQTIKP
jgi:thioredoxin 1